MCSLRVCVFVLVYVCEFKVSISANNLLLYKTATKEQVRHAQGQEAAGIDAADGAGA